MRLVWLERLLAIARRLLGRRREPPVAIERRVAFGREVVTVRANRGPRSLDELAARIELGDWAVAAPGRELVLVRRARLRGRAPVE